VRGFRAAGGKLIAIAAKCGAILEHLQARTVRVHDARLVVNQDDAGVQQIERRRQHIVPQRPGAEQIGNHHGAAHVRIEEAQLVDNVLGEPALLV
jgi:hypothetical protein